MSRKFEFDDIQRKASKWISGLSREEQLLGFFATVFIIIVIRLFFLQVVQGGYYRDLLAGQHYTTSRLQAQRGHIYVTDKAGKNIQLTENVKYFTLFTDPKFITSDEQKLRIIEILTPIFYDHLCVMNGLEEPDAVGCIQNIEEFTNKTLLPDHNTFYTYSGDTLVFVDTEQYEQGIDKVLATFTPEVASNIIKQALVDKIQTGVRTRNYLSQSQDSELIEILQKPPYSAYIDIISSEFIYIKPALVQNPDDAASKLKKTLSQYGIDIELGTIRASMQLQEIRYIRLLTNLNAKIAKRILDAKEEFYDEKYNAIPLMHGFGLEEFQKRYYPHGNFMSHVLGYVDKQDQSFYGIEQFLDKELRGQDGKIIGLATPWIGQIGANSFDIQDPQNGVDVYLTINPVLQKKIEEISNKYKSYFRADSVAIMIMNPHNGKIKAMANAPTFNPNEYEKAYKLKPLSYDERNLLEDLTYVDIPIYYFSGDTMITATIDDRTQLDGKKYVFENYLGPQVFVDKNISFPYEPGSIMKAITLGVGIDSDTINLYDFYNDPGFVKIGPFTIANISDKCTGDNTFMHAVGFSCNVGMVRIAQKLTKYIFYNYLEKLGFGKKTNIELANEEAGTLPDFNTVSVARFFNNTYGQGFLATPLQMISAYSALINGGTYIQPRIIESIVDTETNTPLEIGEKKKLRVFTEETSEDVKEALVGVIESGGLIKYKKEGLSLGAKTGTSEIAFKGQYQGGAGRTNGSLMGLVSAEQSNYVIAIQVRRPRSSPRGSETAGAIFDELADFLVSYDGIDQ